MYLLTKLEYFSLAIFCYVILYSIKLTAQFSIFRCYFKLELKIDLQVNCGCPSPPKDPKRPGFKPEDRPFPSPARPEDDRFSLESCIERQQQQQSIPAEDEKSQDRYSSNSSPIIVEPKPNSPSPSPKPTTTSSSSPLSTSSSSVISNFSVQSLTNNSSPVSRTTHQHII